MDPTLLLPPVLDPDESRSSLLSPSTSFGEADSSWELAHNHSADRTDSSIEHDHSSEDLGSILGQYQNQPAFAGWKSPAPARPPVLALATAARIEIPDDPAASAFSATTADATCSPPSSRFSAWSTGSFIYGRESPPPLPDSDDEPEEKGSPEDPRAQAGDSQAGLLSPQPLSPPSFPPVVRSLSDPLARKLGAAPPSPDVRSLHRAVSADFGEARELGLMQRELSPRPFARAAGVDETAGEGVDGAEEGVDNGLSVLGSTVTGAEAADTSLSSSRLIETARARLERPPSELTPTPLNLEGPFGHRASLAISDRTDTSDDSCPFFYSPPPLQSSFSRSVRDTVPPSLPVSNGSVCHPVPDSPTFPSAPTPLSLSQPRARESYAFPDPTGLNVGRRASGVPLTAPTPTYPPIHPGLLRRSSSATSASDGSESGESNTRSFGWVHDLYDLYSPAGEPAAGSEEVGRLDLVGEGEGDEERDDETGEGGFAGNGGYGQSPGLRVWRDETSLDEDSLSSEPGTAPAMQSVFAALQALATPRPANSEYEGSFVTARSSTGASPLGSPLPDPVRLLLTGTQTTGDERHLRRIGSNTSLLLEPGTRVAGAREKGEGRPRTAADGRDLASELLAARGAVFGLENEVHNLRAQLDGMRKGEERAARVGGKVEEWRRRVEEAEERVREMEEREREREREMGKEREIDEVLAELGVDLTVSSALFLSPEVAFLPVCPHCAQPVQTGRAHSPADADADQAVDEEEPSLDAWVTTHLACLPHITELLAFVQEPEGGAAAAAVAPAGEMGEAL